MRVASQLSAFQNPFFSKLLCDKQFTVKRLRKGIPQNENPGDCGVYTLKYIECLAVGCTFDGLSDANIPVLRRKLAAEIYDEVGLPMISYETQLHSDKVLDDELRLLDSPSI